MRHSYNYIKYAVMIFFSALILFQLILLVIASFKDATEIFRSGMNMKVAGYDLTSDNYLAALSGTTDYLKWYFNSILVVVIQVPLALFLSSLAAFAIRFYNFKLKKLMMIYVIVMMMIPFEIIMLPLYNTVSSMGLLDSYVGLILPYIVSPFAVLFMVQYLRGIDKAFIESARVDGCNELQIYWFIMKPILKPAFAAMGIFTAMNVWNNYLWPLLILSTGSKFTLPIGLASLLTPYGNNYQVLFAGAVLAILPIFILFIKFQKFFMEGMTAGGVK